MILQIYMIIHTLISLVAIFTGLVVVLGMLGGCAGTGVATGGGTAGGNGRTPLTSVQSAADCISRRLFA